MRPRVFCVANYLQRHVPRIVFNTYEFRIRIKNTTSVIKKLTRAPLKFNYLFLCSLNVAGVSLGVQNKIRLVVVLDVWSSYGAGFYCHLG
jgi:hypothetical protein